jgi:hypothetical protein
MNHESIQQQKTIRVGSISYFLSQTIFLLISFRMRSFLVSLFLLHSTTLLSVLANDTCTFDNQIYQRGESYGDSFTTRCGSADDFPCFCNPDLDPPIECNYCSFALQGGGLLCARHNELVRFTDIRGDDKTCSCEASLGAAPSANCEVDINDNSCTVDMPDGSKKIFNDGDVIVHDDMPTHCGTNYPCFCNSGEVECPYCTFNAKDDEKLCATHSETITFQGKDSKYRTCTCEITANGNSSAECLTISGPPTVSPTSQSVFGCSVPDRNGNIVIIEDGASFGSLLEGKCGSFLDWPSFCNVGGESSSITRTSLDDIDYLYCIFENTYSGDTICAKNNEEVTFWDDYGFEMACNCMVLKVGGPTSSCRRVEPTPSPTPLEPILPNSSAAMSLAGSLIVVVAAIGTFTQL